VSSKEEVSGLIGEAGRFEARLNAKHESPQDFQRHLQIVFASRLGFNLRNVVAHGLLPASQFSILTSLMALQGLLLMSLIEAKTKVVAKALETPMALNAMVQQMPLREPLLTVEDGSALAKRLPP
jgi:hypothetical protein